MDGTMLRLKQITIVGTGLLGASLAMALKQRGFTGRLVGVGRRESTLEKTRKLGCFDELTASTQEALLWGRDLPSDEPHLAVVATPLGFFREVLEKISCSDDPRLFVTDVGSTKQSVCELVEEILPDASRFVGSHPMAGSEQTGPEAAVVDLFEGKPCVVTPMGGESDEVLTSVRSMWQIVGMRLFEMPPIMHDRSVALVSHLPHAVAALLVKLAAADGGDALQVASTGFADTTRIASGDPELWIDIFMNNRSSVVEVLQRAEQELESFRKALARSDTGAMRRLLKGAKEARDAWDGGRSGE